jgi:hypothetical protein
LRVCKLNLQNLLLDPAPMRRVTRKMMKCFDLGSYVSRLNLGVVDRPPYGYCLYHGALLAKILGYSGISVLEFGVSGGRGLLNLEYHAEQIQKVVPIDIEVYGFDTGEGLPEPVDYRDLPYVWRKGYHKMDIPKLKKRLKKAKLVLGDVRNTTKTFLEEYNPHPIGAIMFDLDFYSSTVAALQIFDGDEQCFLPRIFCYFDDVSGSELECYNDYTGARLAINEFNKEHEKKKLSQAYHLIIQKSPDEWHHKIWVYHDFEHSKYNNLMSKKIRKTPL